MKWHLTKDKLPEENRLVIIYVPDEPWSWHGKGDIHYKIAWLVRGLSKEDRKKLAKDDPRKNTYCNADEHGNNLVPYCWEEFGPDCYFGQEVKAWAYFDEFEGKMNKEPSPLEALGYLDDIAHGRKMDFDPHYLKTIVEKPLKALEIIRKKEVNVGNFIADYKTFIIESQALDHYNGMCEFQNDDSKPLTKEEFNLLVEEL